MPEIQNLEFTKLLPGQGAEVSALARKAVDMSEFNGFTPDGQRAFERYTEPLAIEQRGRMGFELELAWVSGVLAGMVETKERRIAMLCVHPDYTRKGLGSRLVARALLRCAASDPSIKYISLHAADGATGFYERVGFVRCGSRKESAGIFSTPYKFALKSKPPHTRLRSTSVDFFTFSGTGNTLLAARTIAETLNQEGLTVRLRDMEGSCPALSETTAVGLAFPVACFSTYPSVWRFIDSMPPGEGREVFMAATCAGAGMGMQGPVRAALLEKGYRAVGAKIFLMPGNYNKKTLSLEKNAARVEQTLLEARFFALDLLGGRAKWSEGIPMLSRPLYRLARTRRPWDFFYRFICPIAVSPGKCARCGRCAEDCPTKAITLAEGYPAIDAALCQSCQRCAGFCPAGALGVPGKSFEPYRAMSYEEFKRADG
ncbi:MAG: EFR1 family ferrodoxin [Synergistaceae bacterium]|nr:EFR1 family ferrodoxin [Synergistaceae bacterium]